MPDQTYREIALSHKLSAVRSELATSKKRITELKSALNRLGGSPPPGRLQFSDLAAAQEKRIAELETTLRTVRRLHKLEADLVDERTKQAEQCFNECEVARVAEYERAESLALELGHAKTERNCLAGELEKLKEKNGRLRRYHKLSETEQV